MRRAAESLADMPRSHRAYVPVRPLEHEYRRVHVGGYAMFYWIDEPEKRVTVARVVYARRDLSRQIGLPTRPDADTTAP